MTPGNPERTATSLVKPKRINFKIKSKRMLLQLTSEAVHPPVMMFLTMKRKREQTTKSRLAIDRRLEKALLEVVAIAMGAWSAVALCTADRLLESTRLWW